jgi:hypothetical protein
MLHKKTFSVFFAPHACYVHATRFQGLDVCRGSGARARARSLLKKKRAKMRDCAETRMRACVHHIFAWAGRAAPRLDSRAREPHTRPVRHTPRGCARARRTSRANPNARARARRAMALSSKRVRARRVGFCAGPAAAARQLAPAASVTCVHRQRRARARRQAAAWAENARESALSALFAKTRAAHAPFFSFVLPSLFPRRALVCAAFSRARERHSRPTRHTPRGCARARRAFRAQEKSKRAPTPRDGV